MNETTDYDLLAYIMEEAAGYYEWKKGRLRLLRVILNLSYYLGLPEATIPSHEVLMTHTRLNQKRLSEAIADLVKGRVVKQRGEGKGGVVFEPIPDWMDWGLSSVDKECGDREYVASLVRYIVKKTTAGYVALPYPTQAVDPATQFAIAYTKGEFSQKPLIPNDQTLNEPVAEIARQVAASSVAATETKRQPGRPPKPYEERRHRHSDEVPIDVNIEQVLVDAEKLFGGEWRDRNGEPWERVRREAWFRKVARDRGPRVVLHALRLARDFGPERIGSPCSWLKRVLKDLRPPKSA